MIIQISPSYATTQKAQELIINICRIIHWLEKSEIEDFMFVWWFNKNDDNIDRTLLVKDLSSVGYEIIAVLTPNNNKIVISNKNCKINGYRVCWP